MKITLDLLKDWKACESALPWFEKNWPDGVEDTPQGLVDRITELDRYWYKPWLLDQIINNFPGTQEAEEAYIVICKMAIPNRLALAVVDLPIADTSEAMTKVLTSKDIDALSIVARRATDEAEWKAAIDVIKSDGTVSEKSKLADELSTDPVRAAYLAATTEPIGGTP